MKCELCGRQYVALGVHLRHKHHVDPDDYREEFGILRTTPLVDGDLSAHLSACANARLQDDEYKTEVQARCRENAISKIGKPSPGMTRAGRAALAQRNSEANAKYIKQHAPKIAAVLMEKKTLLDVRKSTGTGPAAAKKMAEAAGIAYSAKAAKEERAERAAATIRSKAMERVAKVMTFFDTTKSAAEMCRLGGISVKTYKNWLKAGLIPRHPNGRGKRHKQT